MICLRLTSDGGEEEEEGEEGWWREALEMKREWGSDKGRWRRRGGKREVNEGIRLEQSVA